MPKISETVRMAASTVDAIPDIPVHAYVTWGTIVEEIGEGSDQQILDGVPGLLWRGTLVEVIKGLWPDLACDEETRRAINAYLRQTENMLCLKRNRIPLWWVRREWNQVDITLPRGFKPVATGRRRKAEQPMPVEKPVTTRWNCLRAECGFSTEDRGRLDAHHGEHLRMEDKLAARNKALHDEVSRLESEVDKLRKMLVGVQNALGGR